MKISSCYFPFLTTLALLSATPNIIETMLYCFLLAKKQAETLAPSIQEKCHGYPCFIFVEPLIPHPRVRRSFESQVYCATSGLMKNKGNFGEKPEMAGLKKHQMTALMHQPHLDRGGAQFSEHRPPLVPWCNRANPGDYICVYI